MIYLDCTWIYRSPSDNTGIQRVTRSITRESMKCRNDIYPAILNDDGIFYRLTDIPMPNNAPFSFRGEKISFVSGDIYFVLDSTWENKILERLSPLKTCGVTTGVMYHDLIPITHANVCGVSKALFSDWVIETAKYSDFFACNSNATKEALKHELANLYPNREINDDIAFSFRLGADISTYDVSYVPPSDTLLKAFNDNSTYLIVSTIEPRKNHAMLLDAFDKLWINFPKIKLCFIGKEGWMIEEVIKRVRTHPKLNSNLFWLEGIKDNDVQWAYRNAKCVLFPSFEEGFGLPIIEALHCETPVLASDIPVFHEVAGNRIGYLDPHDPMTLVKWVELIEQKGVPKEIIPDGSFKWATWRDSAEELLQKIELANNYARRTLAPILKRYAFEQRVAVEIARMGDSSSVEDTVAEIIPINMNTPTSQQKELQLHEQNVTEKTEQSTTVMSISSLTIKKLLSKDPHISPPSVKQLLSMDGRQLIHETYLRMLHRVPDQDGEERYFDMLKKGLTPLGLISAIRFSDEGKQVAEPVRYKIILRVLGALSRTKRFPGKIARYLSSLFLINKTKNLSRAAVMELQEQNSKIKKHEIQLLEQNSKLQEQATSLLEQLQMQNANLLDSIQTVKSAFLEQEGRLEDQKAFLLGRLLEQESIIRGHDTELQDQRTILLIQSSKLQEYNVHLYELNSKLQEQKSHLLEQYSKSQEQDTRLFEQDSKLQEQDIRLIEQSIKLQEQDVRLIEQSSKLQEQNTNLLEQSSKLLEQETRLNEQSSKTQEQENHLIEQKLILQEQDTRLIEQNSKLQEQDTRLLEQSSKLQEQDTRLTEQNSKLQEQDTRLIEHNSKLQEQDTRLLEQSTKQQVQETRLIEQSLKLQEQDTHLIEQNTKLQEQNDRLIEQSSKMQDIDTHLLEQNSRLQEQENRIQTIEIVIQRPTLPFSSYSESEPYLKRAEKRVGEKAPTDYSEKREKFYTYFSEIWGEGYEEVQRQHYESYLPYLPRKSKHQFLDIGCGAGEFLGHMQGHGIKTMGIDIDESEIARCVERGLIVQQAEAIDFLKKYDGLFSGISLLQVIEHIPQEQHVELLLLAKEKLPDNGVLIIETINPAHPLAFSGFFTDPTHIRPIPIDYLAFLVQWCGFRSTGTLSLFPAPLFPSSITDPKLHYYNYAIVARKGRKL